jgi:hypothetical protein
MTLRRLLTLLPALTLSMSVACFDDKDDDDEDEDEDDDSGHGGDTTWGSTTTSSWTTTGGTTGSSGTPLVSVDWGSNSVGLSVSEGPGAYWFGMAETSGCSDCWTGEDCVFGYDASGTTLAYCHDGGDTGTSLSYGGDAGALAAGTTVFRSSSSSGDVTYYLESDSNYGGDGSCYTWGNDPSYYDGLGCTSL